MSIEGGGTSSGGSIGGGISGGVATLGGGVGISAGPSIGAAAIESGGFSVPGIGGGPLSLESFGANMTVPLHGSFLENTMPYTINTLNAVRPADVLTEAAKPQINVSSVIAEAIFGDSNVDGIGAKAEYSGVPAIFQAGLEDVNLDPGIEVSVPKLDIFDRSVAVAQLPPLHISKPAEVIEEVTARSLFPTPLAVPAVLPEVSQVALINTEPKVGLQASTAIKPESNLVYIQPQTGVTAVETPQVEEFEGLEEEREEEESEEKIVEHKLSHSVDERTVRKRVNKIKDAGVRALAEIKSELTKAKKAGKVVQIEGWRIVNYLLSLSPLGLRGQELEQADPTGTLPDGTWEANMEKIGQERFSSAQDVAERSPKIVALDNPVAKGKGKEVTDKNMYTTYKHDETRVHTVRQVIKKVIKMLKRRKSVQKPQQPVQIISLEEKRSERNERNIHQLDPDLAQALKAP